MMKHQTSLLHAVAITIVVITASLIPSTEADSALLESILRKIEADTFTLAHKMEDLIVNKCNFTSDETCYQANYHPCFSELKQATCPGKDYAIQQCGVGNDGGCGGFFDFTTSTVSFPHDTQSRNPPHLVEEDIRVKDGVCTTLRIEDYMKTATEASRPYWENLGVHPPSLYYGTDDG